MEIHYTSFDDSISVTSEQTDRQTRGGIMSTFFPLVFVTYQNFSSTYCRVRTLLLICVNKYPTRYNIIQFIYICNLLYIFRVVSPPNIRSSCHCIYSIWH